MASKSFHQYRVKANTDKPQQLVDPMLKFFNGGFLMPAKQGGMLAYPYNNNQSGYVAPRMDDGGFATTTQTTFPPFMGPIILPGNPLMNLVTKAVGYFTGDDKKPAPAPTPAQQKILYDQMRDLYSNADRTFYRDHPYMDKVPYSGKTIKLTKGRLTGAEVDTGLLDFIKKTAAKNNMDPYKLAALISRESTFGVGTGSDRAGSLQSLASGWNVDQDYVPYQLDRFLADRQVPGVKTVKDKRGWRFFVDDQAKVNDYLKNHPQLLQQYQKKLSGVKALDKNATYFDLAGQWINKPGGVRKYNPGAPGYENLYNQDLNLLRSDPAFSKYFGGREFGGDVGIYGYRNYDEDILMNKSHGGDISVPDLSQHIPVYDDGGGFIVKGFMTTSTTTQNPNVGSQAKVAGASGKAEPSLTADDETTWREGLNEGKQWLKDWYAKRSTLPQFKTIANQRLRAMNKNYIGYDDMDQKESPGATAFYRPSDGNVHFQMGDPYSFSAATILHEYLHGLDHQVPQDYQEFLTKKNLIPEKKWLKTYTGKNATDPEFKYPYYSNPTEVRARLNTFRRRYNIDPTKRYTKEEMQDIINHYRNEISPDPDKVPSDFQYNKRSGTSDNDIDQLLDILGNDPAKLAELNNTIVKLNNNIGTDRAAYGMQVDDKPKKKKVTYKQAFEKGRDYNTAWMNSPMYKKMLETSLGFRINPQARLLFGYQIPRVNNPAEQIDIDRKYQAANVQWGVGPKHPLNPEGTAAEANSWMPWYAPMANKPINYNTYLNPKPKYPNSFPYLNFVKGVAGKNGDDLVSDAVHEFSHLTDANGNLIPQKDIDLMSKYAAPSYLQSPMYQRLLKEIGKEGAQAFKKEGDKWLPYVKNFTETRARLNDFRMRAKEQGVYDPFTQPFNINYFKNYKQIPDVNGSYFDPLKQLRDVYSDEEISDMLNKISKSNNESDISRTTAEYGMQVFEDGGEISDDGELPTAAGGMQVNAPCPPGPKGEMMIRVDGNCVPYSSIKTSVFLANDQGDYSTKWTKFAGASTAPGSKLPPIVGPGVTYPAYLKEAYEKSKLPGMKEEKDQMIYQDGKWVKASQALTQDQILAKHFTKKQQAAVDKYWNDQMADPDIKDFIMNDPVAYQSLRLEAYRAAGVDKYTMQNKACAAGFGYVWDDEKQTCVPIKTKHRVSKEGAYRSLNPMYYREAIVGQIGNKGLTGHDAVIDKVLPRGGIAFDRFYGKNKLPIYVENIPGNSTVLPDLQLADVFYDPTGKYKFANVAHASRDKKTLEDVNNQLASNQNEEFQAEETLNKTLETIYKNGLKSTGTISSDWLIKPGQFKSPNDPALEAYVKQWTVNSPGFQTGADWRLYSGNLDKLYNQGSWLNRAINTLSMGSNLAESTGYGKTGYAIPDFFRNVALGTGNDIGTAFRLGRGAYNKTFGNPNDAVLNSDGISIDSPTGIGEENAHFGKSNIGVLGFGNLPTAWQATKDLSVSGQKFWEHPSFSGLGNLALNIVNVPFQTWLSTPIYGGISRTAIKTAEKETAGLAGKSWLKGGLKATGQSVKRTVGDIIGNYEGKNLLQKGKTFLGTPVRAVSYGYWNPATKLTQFPMRAFGKGVAASPFGFRGGSYLWDQTTGTNPFRFMYDPIPESFYTAGSNYNLGDGEKKVVQQQFVAPKIPRAYQNEADTIYNLKIGNKVFPIDTRTKDGKELFNSGLFKFNASDYDVNKGYFNIKAKDKSEEALLQELFRGVLQNIQSNKK